MLTVTIVRGHASGYTGFIVDALCSEILDQTFADDEELVDEGPVIRSYKYDPDQFDSVKKTWEEIGTNLVEAITGGIYNHYVIAGIDIASQDFVKYIRKITKPFDALVVDVTVKGDAPSYMDDSHIRAMKKFNKELFV